MKIPVGTYVVLLRRELLELWRTGRLPIVAVVFLLFGFSSPLLARYTPDIVRMASSALAVNVPNPTTRDAVDQFIKNLTQVGALAAILLTMGSVATEKEAGTAALVLVKPVRRGTFLAAKFSGIALAIAVMAMVCGLGAYAYTAILFDTLPLPGFIAACLVMWLGLVEIASVTFLGSTLLRSAIPAAVFGIVALVVAGILGAIPHIGPYTPFGMNDLARSLALSQPPGHWVGPLFANAGYALVALAASWFIFRRQEV
ncbi:MAG: ABC transporter permease [Candidatus Dormibacteria bacterium]